MSIDIILASLHNQSKILSAAPTQVRRLSHSLSAHIFIHAGGMVSYEILILFDGDYDAPKFSTILLTAIVT